MRGGARPSPAVAVRAGSIALLILLVLACGRSATLGTSFPDNRPDHVQALLKRLPAPALPTSPSNDTGRPLVVVALDGEPSGLAAFDAESGEALWRAELRVDSPVYVGGPVVVVRSGDSIVGLSVRDGRRLWRRGTDALDFMGADIDSGIVALSFSTAGQRASTFREGRIIALDAATGRVRFNSGPIDKQLGAPAVRGGIVFVPWDRLSISAFDVSTGREVARLLSRDDVFAFVQAGPEGVYYGSTGVYRLTERSVDGTRRGSDVYEPLVANAPGASSFGADSFLGVTAGRNARSKIRFLWRGSADRSEPVSLLDDRAYFLYFRILFGFEARTGEVRWAYQQERDAEAAAVVPGGVLLLDGAGVLTGIDAVTGQLVHRVELGVPVASAAFDVPTLPLHGPLGPMPGSVTDQLLDIIFDPDTRLTPARRFAVAVLASIPDPEATRDLLAVCQHGRTPEAVRGDAAIVLRTRQTGAEYLQEALSEHHDFLEDREAPPVGIIAASVLHMGASAAVPRLLAHFLDPETPRGDLAALAATLNALGEASMVDDLRQFIVTYRADSEFLGAAETLVEVARAIARHGSDRDREALGALAAAPHTNPALVEALPQVLAPPEPEGEGAPGGGAELRRSMTSAQVNEVMQAARDRIRPCIQAAMRRTEGSLSSIAMTMVVTGEGDLEELTVAPQDDILGSCLTLSLAESRFPSSDLDRQRVEYTIRIE